jgi:hypothetical protein
MTGWLGGGRTVRYTGRVVNEVLETISRKTLVTEGALNGRQGHRERVVVSRNQYL